jgi:hypothetical protein
LEIGQPINSENCSETAEGVARESEGRSRLSLLRAVRQDHAKQLENPSKAQPRNPTKLAKLTPANHFISAEGVVSQRSRASLPASAGHGRFDLQDDR